MTKQTIYILQKNGLQSIKKTFFRHLNSSKHLTSCNVILTMGGGTPLHIITLRSRAKKMRSHPPNGGHP